MKKKNLKDGETKVEDTKNQNGVKFKSNLIQSLMNKYKKQNLSEEEIEKMPKDANAVNLSEILSVIESLPEQEIQNIIEDIISNNITVNMNAQAINLLNEQKDNKDEMSEDEKKAEHEKQQKITSLLKGIGNKAKINIDINSISELSSNQLTNIAKSCKINKVYVNSGYDVAARDGYNVEKYIQISNTAEAMINTAVGKNHQKMSELEKFKKIYKYVVDNTKYDYGEVEDHCHNSRNLDNFFTKGRKVYDGKVKGKGKAICAGISDGLKNLCDCMGIESQYVQGYATRNDGTKVYHAWLKVKIDGKWYNADPTWDLGKVGIKPFTYCLKSDEEFNKDHKIDYNYNPNYFRHESGRNIALPRITYKTSNQSMNAVMKEYETPEYNTKYSMSRAANNIVQTIKPHISNEVLENLTENQIPANVETRKKLTLKQKIANLLYKGKILKNIPFVKKFIEKNSTEVSQKTPKNSTNKNDMSYIKTSGNLDKAKVRYSEIKDVKTEKSKQEDRAI